MVRGSPVGPPGGWSLAARSDEGKALDPPLGFESRLEPQHTLKSPIHCNGVGLHNGMFVDPDFGPVLANYGLDDLRFAQPVNVGDTLKVRLTCKQKTLRMESGYGEVRWDTEVTNQDEEVVATYDVLTMVATDDEWARISA